ncbi:hypothetical protein FJ656_22660 [Schumannella luteola]|nr:hypothetical protein FJ656_22660 [Schumannella luteola]
MPCSWSIGVDGPPIGSATGSSGASSATRAASANAGASPTTEIRGSAGTPKAPARVPGVASSKAISNS